MLYNEKVIKHIYDNSNIYTEGSDGMKYYIEFHYERFAFIINQMGKSGLEFKSPVLDVASGEGVFYPVVKHYLKHILPYYITDYHDFGKFTLDGDEIVVKKFHCEDDEIEYENDFFSTVFFFDVLEHLIKDPIKPFIEMNRVLKKDGYLIINTPNASSVLKIFEIMNGRNPESNNIISEHIGERHNREFTVDEIFNIAKVTGFEVVYYDTRIDKYENISDLYDNIKPFMPRYESLKKLGPDLFFILKKKSNIIYISNEDRYPEWLYIRDFRKSTPTFSGLPICMELETSGSCNVNPPCVMCGRNDCNKNIFLDDTVYERVKPVLPNLSNISFHGNGEPWLYPGLEDITNKTSKCHRSFSTGGHLLNEERIKFLVDNKFEFINISIDAALEETHNKIRNTGFKKIISNIVELQEYKMKNKTDFPKIYINATLMKWNIKESPDIVLLAWSLSADMVLFWPLNDMYDWEVVRDGHRFVYKDQLCSNFPEIYDEYLVKSIKLAEKLNIRIDYTHLNNKESLLEYDIDVPENIKRKVKHVRFNDPLPSNDVCNSMLGRTDLMCERPWLNVLIHADGDVRMCCFQKESLGSLKENSFDEIWFGERSKVVRESMMKGKMPETCLKSKNICNVRRNMEIKENPILANEIAIQNTFKDSFIGAFYYAWYTDKWEKQCSRHSRYRVGPSGGYYESKESSVIQKHAEEASRNGIDFFISSFNGEKSFEELEFMADNLGDFKFAIHYETVNIFPDPVEFNEAYLELLKIHFKGICKRLISGNNYYRIDDKPVIFIYTSRRIMGDLSEIDLIRETCKEELQVECIVVGDEMWWDDEDWIGSAERLQKFDYVYPYNLYTPIGTNGNEGFTGKQYLDLIEPVYARFHDKARSANTGLVPNILPRYNDESVRNNKGHYPLPPYGTQFYEDYFNMCKKYFLGDYKILTITSFNEWYEDSQIESTGESYNGNEDDYDDNPNYGDVFLKKTLEFKQEMKGDNMAKTEKAKLSLLEAIRKDSKVHSKHKLKNNVAFKFKEYRKKDSGSILYFMNRDEDPVIAFEKRKDNLHILFHNGEKWKKMKTDIKCFEDFYVEIKGMGLGDVYINGEKITDLIKMKADRLVEPYEKVCVFKAHNPKFPDPEPKISKMMEFRVKQGL